MTPLVTRAARRRSGPLLLTEGPQTLEVRVTEHLDLRSLVVTVFTDSRGVRVGAVRGRKAVYVWQGRDLLGPPVPTEAVCQAAVMRGPGREGGGPLRRKGGWGRGRGRGAGGRCEN